MKKFFSNYEILNFKKFKIKKIDKKIDFLKANKTIDGELTKKMVRQKLQNSDMDFEIETNYLKVSLQCPLMKFRIQIPTRAVSCKHIQCFDLESYLMMNEKKPTWLCPVCDQHTPFDSLVIDSLFQDILKKCPDFEDVQFNAEAEWRRADKRDIRSERDIELIEIDKSNVEICDQRGEFIKTSLLKTNNGFGFTIIGGNETSEDFLQIKHIVPDGAAARDGKLRQGDVLVYVNNECVLGYTYQDVVEIFQSIPKGNFVDLAVCRGYPLSIDPNDPNIEIISLTVINRESQVPLEAVDELTFSTLINFSSQNINQSVKQIPVELELNPQAPSSSSLGNNQETNASERCSKAPNILQSSSSKTNLQSNFKQSGANPPQLRSKKPTTDRVLFQHTLYDPAPQTAHTLTNDYIYLNGQSNHKSVNDLYSTVNRKPFDQIDSEKHIPIYGSATNLQHQRVQQNLNKFQQIQKNQKMNPLISNRSKTPGPDMIYFRNNSSPNENFSSYSNYAITSKPTNFLPNVSPIAKMPTADMMFYPSKPSNQQPMRQSFNFMDYQNEVENEFVECTNEDLVSLFNRMDKNSIRITNDVDGSNFLEMSIDLVRQESGFGFRIVGGEEEGSQVAVRYINQGGAAHLDNRIRPNDEIVMIDNLCVVGATHRRVVQLMTIAGLNRRVKLMIRRKISQQQYQMLISMQQQRSRPAANSNSTQGQKYPFTITFFLNGNEGLGLSMNKNGPSIGEIVENSPAERCKRLNVGDKILAVNGINMTQMSHIDIVKLFKESGYYITLTIGSGTYNENSNLVAGEKLSKRKSRSVSRSKTTTFETNI